MSFHGGGKNVAAKNGANQSQGRANHYYRKLFLDNYMYNQSGRGLGKHRLPSVRPTPKHKQRNFRHEPAVQLLLVFGLLVVCFICTVLTALAVRALQSF